MNWNTQGSDLVVEFHDGVDGYIFRPGHDSIHSFLVLRRVVFVDQLHAPAALRHPLVEEPTVLFSELEDHEAQRNEREPGRKEVVLDLVEASELNKTSKRSKDTMGLRGDTCILGQSP